MNYLLNLALEGRAAVVAGGGEVAARKVQDLLAAKAHVTVIAPQLCEAIVARADAWAGQRGGPSGAGGGPAAGRISYTPSLRRIVIMGHQFVNAD